MKIFKKLFGRERDRKAPTSVGTQTRLKSTAALEKLTREDTPDIVELDASASGPLAANAPNVPGKARERRRNDVRHSAEDRISMEDQGLDSTDEHGLDSNDGAGIDPYNTGKFDRSKNWDKRFRK